MFSIRFIVLFHFKEFVVHCRHCQTQVFALLVYGFHIYLEEFHLRWFVCRGDVTFCLWLNPFRTGLLWCTTSSYQPVCLGYF